MLNMLFFGLYYFLLDHSSGYLIVVLFVVTLKFINGIDLTNLIKCIFTDLVMAMFDCAVTLGNVEVSREDVAESLSKIGIEQPTIFLSAAYTYLMQHSKVYGMFSSLSLEYDYIYLLFYKFFSVSLNLLYISCF